MTGRSLALVIFLAALPACLSASGSADLTAGGRAFQSGRYDEAMAAYDRASVKDPESPYVHFGRGAVLYRQEELEKAKDAFRQAALKTKDLRFEAKAHYNLGNCFFRDGQRQQETDLEKSVAAYQEAVASYRKALELDPALHDAEHNIEVTRIVLKDLLDKLKKQQEEQAKNQEIYKDVIEKLKELIERQEAEVGDNQALGTEQGKSGRTAQVTRGVENLATEQETTRTGTRELAERILAIIAESGQAQGAGGASQGAAQGAQAAETGPEAAAGHVEKAQAEQAYAVAALRAGDLPGALPPQQKALLELQDALKSLSGEGEQQQEQQGQQQGQQDQQERQEQDRNQEQAADARRIIEEENRRDREKESQAPAGYAGVDKDW